MQEQDLFGILDRLPGYSYYPNVSGDWAIVPCLLAPITHARGTDRNPSMSISVGIEESYAFCHACHHSKNLKDTLVMAYKHGLYPGMGSVPLDAQRLENLAGGDLARLAGKLGTRDKIKDTDFTDSLYEISGQPWPSHGVDFLASKGVSLKTALRFGCEFLPAGFEHDSFVDRKGDMAPIKADGILLPVLILVKGKLKCVGAQFRPLEQVTLKYFSPWRFSSSYYFFGQQFMPFMAGRPIALVEGSFDTMHLFQERLPSLALNGLSMRKNRVDLLTSARPSTIMILLDPDKAGTDAVERILPTISEAGLPVIVITGSSDPKFLSSTQLTKLHPIIAAHYTNVKQEPKS